MLIKSPRILVGLVVLLMMSTASSVLAQCAACDISVDVRASGTYTYRFEGTPFRATEWAAAANEWTNAFSPASNVRVVESSSGEWTIKLDYGTPGWGYVSRQYKVIYIHPNALSEDFGFVQWLIRHEFGHMLGFGGTTCSPQVSVMAERQPGTQGAVNVACADVRKVEETYTPPPSGEDPPPEECGGGCECDHDCSPIIIRLGLGGIKLSDVHNGVQFDIGGRGTRDLVAWPLDPDSAWLALDRNGNGIIDDGSELFGNSTRLSSGVWALHGYELLRDLDSNHDGKIDGQDPAFDLLRLWRDLTRDGVCKPFELVTLQSAGILSISLDYRQSSRVDRWGNRFSYRSLVHAVVPPKWRFSYDVFLQVLPR